MFCLPLNPSFWGAPLLFRYSLGGSLAYAALINFMVNKWVLGLGIN